MKNGIHSIRFQVFRAKSEQSRFFFVSNKKRGEIGFHSIFNNIQFTLSKWIIWLSMQLMHFNADTCVFVCVCENGNGPYKTSPCCTGKKVFAATGTATATATATTMATIHNRARASARAKHTE